MNFRHPTICKLLKGLQREESLQEAILTKWKAGETRVNTKKEVDRNTRIQALVSDYENRDTLTYLRAVVANLFTSVTPDTKIGKTRPLLLIKRC